MLRQQDRLAVQQHHVPRLAARRLEGQPVGGPVRDRQGQLHLRRAQLAHRLRHRSESELTVDGLGPLSFAPEKATTYVKVFPNLERLGYVRKGNVDECTAWVEGPELVKRGISVTGLADVAVDQPGIKTDKGAEVGMTIGQVKAIYGSAFQQVLKQNHAEKQYFGSVKVGNRELQFRVLGEPYSDGAHRYAPLTPLKDSDIVHVIAAQTYLTDVSFGGC